MTNFSTIPFAVISPMVLGLFYDIEGSYFTGVIFLALLCAAAVPVSFMLRLPRGSADPFLRREGDPETRAA